MSRCDMDCWHVDDTNDTETDSCCAAVSVSRKSDAAAALLEDH